MLAHWTDGRIKMYLTTVGLAMRRALPGLFLQGEYIALETSGAKQNHVVAFARREAGKTVIAIVPRLVAGLGTGLMAGTPADAVAGTPASAMTGLTTASPEFAASATVWEDTQVTLPAESAASYRNVFTGEEVSVENGSLAVAEALRTLPVALLWASPRQGMTNVSLRQSTTLRATGYGKT